ncbi:T9SS type A sorting domain-containing protein [Polaribacter batillariae]|uniref:T9SS type A sorting domain-containing protein n=1 Tax=Polaribacter batillariae TaxID=2808900 RepID=A0ABX7T0B4_9FLAO|nr:T9SS type A sorting domain-containing protein [Polaribacter batillariae]QTD38518.1 T9SS type A sorting domain-containing protein [Polaribacter batillariae]
MKKITLSAFFLFLSTIGFSQVVNGTFDTDINGWVSQNSGTISHEASEGATANGSLKIIATSLQNSGAKIDPNITLTQAGNYLLKFKVKGTKDSQIRGDVFQGSFFGGAVYTIKATDVWEEYVTTFNGLTTDPLNLRIIARTGNATYLIDDVELLETTTEDMFVTNGDFETGSLDGWTNNGADVSLTSGTGNGSTTAAVLTFTQDITTFNFLDNDEYDFGQTVNPSSISISFDAKSNNTAIELQVVFRTLDASGAVLETANTGKKTVTVADTWETITFNKPITKPFHKIQVRLKINESSTAFTGDTVTFDNVSSQFSHVVLGVEDNKFATDVSVYPNPSNGIVNIKTKAQLSSVQLFNLIGKKVFEINKFNNQSLNFSQFSKGMYLLRLIDENNNTKTQKLIIN